MHDVPWYIQLALDKSEGQPLTTDEIDVCEEWNTGKALENIKIDTGDPRLLEYASLYDKLESKKSAVWEGIVLADNLIKYKRNWWTVTYTIVRRAFSNFLYFIKLSRRHDNARKP